MTTEQAIKLLHRLQDEQFDGEYGDERREALSMAVRALEGDEDLISRKAAIDAVVSAMIDGADAELVEGVMELLPSAQPHWTPCSERLPEENSDILVTYVEKDEKRIVPVNYGCGTWFDCFFNKVLNQVGVLAWMPLPEPYRGESE